MVIVQYVCGVPYSVSPCEIRVSLSREKTTFPFPFGDDNYMEI